MASEYSGGLNHTLKAESANTPPLVLDADAEETTWHASSTSTAPRLHSVAKRDEIARQVAQITRDQPH
jgi:hypothetical protein